MLDVRASTGTGRPAHDSERHDDTAQPGRVSSPAQRCIYRVGRAGLGKSLFARGALCVVLVAHRAEVRRVEATVRGVAHAFDVIDIDGRSTAALDDAQRRAGEVSRPQPQPVAIIAALGRTGPKRQPFTVANHLGASFSVRAEWTMEAGSLRHRLQAHR